MHLLSLKNAFRARLPPNLPCGNDPTVANHNGGPIRGGSEEDPTTPETVSHPSHRRGRSSRFGDRLCMEKHLRIRASAISQKRISCETSSKFTMRERSYSCKSQWRTDSRRIRGGSDHTRDRLAPVAPQR